MDTNLQQLIDAISKIAPAAWASMVYQAQLYGYSYVGWGLFWLVMVWPSIKWCKFFTLKTIAEAKLEYHERKNDMAYGLFAAMLGIGVVFSIIIGLNMFSDGLMHLLNPSYYAIQYILGHNP